MLVKTEHWSKHSLDLIIERKGQYGITEDYRVLHYGSPGVAAHWMEFSNKGEAKEFVERNA